ncbi:hypothetical protein Naga_100417g6 [Nannochloropsis gaditana]|uniref:Uncharacterized protein n=1 Tax=Nannochloropsis gaditana TaxID=72520 RepID=W7THE8_9STRA|nr:hypothetical protein Naga_100417g6 [Nannochloropsis gaditana]
MDPTICIMMCCSLLYHVMVCVHLIILYVILLYDNRTGVDQCLQLSVVLVVLVQDSWLNRLGYILRKNSNCTEELIGYWITFDIWFVYSHQVMGPN